MPAVHSLRILYKLRGTQHCNFPLTGEEMQRLDGMTLQTLVDSLKSPAAAAASAAARAATAGFGFGGGIALPQLNGMGMPGDAGMLQLQLQHFQQMQENDVFPAM